MFELLIVDMGSLVLISSLVTWRVYDYGLSVYESLPAHIHSDSEHVFNLQIVFLDCTVVTTLMDTVGMYTIEADTFRVGSLW